MVLLRCTNGKGNCTYEVTYPDRALASLVNTAKRNAQFVPAGVPGYHCPRCKRYPLKVMKSKEPAS